MRDVRVHGVQVSEINCGGKSGGEGGEDGRK